MIIRGDALKMLKLVPTNSVDCIVTSPPYWGLRDYGVDGQLGLEKTPDEYVQNLVAVFREARRALKDDGTLWLNLGDSYQDKHLAGIPWRVAFALQADGWYLRQDIIWHKPNPMPESVRDRCTKAHEYIFLLSKSDRYHFDHVAIQEPAVSAAEAKWAGSASGLHSGQSFRGTGKSTRRFGSGNKVRKDRPNADALNRGHQAGSVPWDLKPMRNKRSVWSVTSRPFKGAHFATFPPDLIKPCILAGCPIDGTVLDPFFGAGTVGLVADELDRNWIGIELNRDYVEIARQRLECQRDTKQY